MSGQIPRPIRSIALASTFLVSGLGATVATNSTRAADCVTAPTSSAPQNNHWYYRTDRTKQRKCWYLRAANQPSQQGAVQTAPEEALTKPSQSVPAASSQRSTKLSDAEVEKLYAEFLEWSRRAKN